MAILSNKDRAPKGTIYFHASCFDGAVSAAVASLLLERRNGWRDWRAVPVTYGHPAAWLGQIDTPAAVVDFLFHPAASFWADHHPSAFLNPELRADFERRNDPQMLMFDPDASSCADLLWTRGAEWLTGLGWLGETIRWASKIDSADYVNVEEALFSEAPAMRVAAALAMPADAAFGLELVRYLRDVPLEIIASDVRVKAGFANTQAAISIGIKQIKATGKIDDSGIALFEADSTQAPLNRYIPFLVFPSARYSLGSIRTRVGYKITAMRNPWTPFASAPLDKVFTQFGGGGHHRIGSLNLNGAGSATAHALVDAIRLAIKNSEPKSPAAQ